MPLRFFFETLLGGVFELTFKILPILGNNMNYLFMAIIAGLGVYWLLEMLKHQKAGEK